MSELCPLLKTPKKKQLHKKMNSEINISLQLRRMRMRVLSLPTCPNWRKARVGNSDKEEVPSEWEMEQVALDKLRLRRQQSLVQRQIELITLRQQVMAVSMEELNGITAVDFMTPIQLGDLDHIHHSLMFQRTSTKNSLSMQNLVEFGQMESEQAPTTTTHTNTKEKATFHLSNEKLMEIQRTKKLDKIRQELDEFKAIHLQRQATIEEETKCNKGGRIAGMTHVLDSPLGSQRFRGSILTFVSLDGSEDGKSVPDIIHRIQKLREKELRKIRKQNMVLEYQLQQFVQ